MIGGCVSVAISKRFVKLWHLLDKGHLECLWWSKKGHCQALAWRRLGSLTCWGLRCQKILFSACCLGAGSISSWINCVMCLVWEQQWRLDQQYQGHQHIWLVDVSLLLFQKDLSSFGISWTRVTWSVCGSPRKTLSEAEAWRRPVSLTCWGLRCQRILFSACCLGAGSLSSNLGGWFNNIRGSTHMIGGCVSVAVSKFVRLVTSWTRVTWSVCGSEAEAWRRLVSLTCWGLRCQTRLFSAGCLGAGWISSQTNCVMCLIWEQQYESWINYIRGSTHMIGGCVSVAAVSKGFVKPVISWTRVTWSACGAPRKTFVKQWPGHVRLVSLTCWGLRGQTIQCMLPWSRLNLTLD